MILTHFGTLAQYISSGCLLIHSFKTIQFVCSTWNIFFYNHNMTWKEQDSINKIPPDGTMWPGKYIHPKGWMTYATIWKCFALSRFVWVSFLLDAFQLFLLFSCFYRKETINIPICAQFLILYPWVSWDLVNLFPLIYISYLHLRPHGCSTLYRYWNVASLGDSVLSVKSHLKFCPHVLPASCHLIMSALFIYICLGDFF